MKLFLNIAFLCTLLLSLATLSYVDAHADGFTPNPPVSVPPSVVTHTPLMHTIWLQVTDSCRQELSGASFAVVGNGVNELTAPTSGSLARTQSISGAAKQCPVPQGSCVNNASGCVSVSLPTFATYMVTVVKTPPGRGANLRYAVCQGGSVCPRGPEVATVHIAPGGTVSATTLNYYPDGTSVTYGPFTGTISNPILFHLFGIGNGSVQCDGDHDADDFLTGTPGKHCDSDHDKK